MSIENGSYIKSILDGQPIASVKTDSFNPVVAVRDVSNKDLGQYKAHEYGLMEFDMSCDGLVLVNAKNKLQFSERLNKPSTWFKDDASLTVADENSVGPTGAKNGSLITFNSGTYLAQSASSILFSVQYCFSIWLKGTGTIDISLIDDGAGSFLYTNTVTLTSTFTRYFITCPISSGATLVAAYITKNTATSVSATQAQLEDSLTMTSYVNSGYVIKQLMDAEVAQTKFPFEFSDFLPTNMKLSGTCLITSLQIKSPHGESLTFTCNLKGTGTLTQSII